MSDITIPTKLIAYYKTDIEFWQKFGTPANEKLKYNSVYLGEGKENTGDGRAWEYDAFLITIQVGDKVETFSYKTGLGHRVAVNKRDNYVAQREKARRAFPVVKREAELVGAPKPVVIDGQNADYPHVRKHPSFCSVIWSLLSDASLGDMTFEDHCAELGYDTDSRKALEGYLACQKIDGQLRRLFGSAHVEEMREALEDY